MKKNKIVPFVILFISFVLFSRILVKADTASEKAITLMVYMTGADLESNHSAATIDMQEIIDSGFDADAMNIVFMTGGAATWHNGLPADGIVISKCVKNHCVINEIVPDISNMGDPATLTYFLDYAVEKYPAREYALILWGHGGGPMEGVCFDENYMDSLSLDELSTALHSSPFGSEKRLKWMGIDADLMASVELANVCSPYAEYMIASQSTGPIFGWDYSFLDSLREGMDGRELGELIISNYMHNADEKYTMTLSCTDLGKIDRVDTAVNTLFSSISHGLDVDTYPDYARRREAVKGFGRSLASFDYDLVDAVHLAEYYMDIAPEEAAVLKQAIADAVLFYDGNQENANGLSIYYPYYNKNEYVQKWKTEYEGWEFLNEYCRYLKRFASIWIGEQPVD